MSAEVRGRASPLPRLLREARRKAALSGRELAALAKVPQPTIAAAELGRDPHHSTLQALVSAVPTLDPRALLGRPATGALPASARGWSWEATVHGFHATRLALDVAVGEDGSQRATLRVTGLRCTRGSLRDPARRKSVAGGLMVGPLFAAIQLLHREELGPGARVEMEDAGLLHAFAMDRRGERLDYTCRELASRPAGTEMIGQAPHGRPFGLGCAVSLDVPVRSLVLRAAFTGSGKPPSVRPEAWPGSLAMQPASPWSWPALYPHSPRRIVTTPRGVAQLRIDKPVTGLGHGLSWDAEADGGPGVPSPAAARPDDGRPVQVVLRDLRAREGLTARALARVVRLSPSSVLALERGGDPRLSTLRRYAEAFPGLGAFELFSPHQPRGGVTLEEAWEWQRQLFGVECVEDVTECVISKDGTPHLTMTTHGLTWTSPARRELRLRHGIVKVADDKPWNLESVHARAGDARVRVVRRGKGQVVHDLTLRRTGPGRVSFTRRLTGHGQYALWKNRAWHEGLRATRTWESFYAEPSLPARRCTITLRFPRGYWPPHAWAPVTPKAILLMEGADDVATLVHGDGFRFTQDRARSTLRIEVERPLVGLRYLFAWRLA